MNTATVNNLNNYPLSALQRAILEIAAEKQFVNYPDILTTYYGFTPRRRGGQAFAGHDQGKLQVARVGICKAFNRLERRGLVRRVNEKGAWYSITLVKNAGNL